jgi:hypothetical protein
MMPVLHCPYGQGTDSIRPDQTRHGQQRSGCQEAVCDGRTVLVDDSYAGHAAEIKQPLVAMAMNASGIRDTARVLHGSPTTGITELQKRAGVAAREACGAGVRASRAGRGGNLARGCAGGVSWTALRARRHVEFCANESASAMALARHGSPDRKGMSVCVRAAEGRRVPEAAKAARALWHHKV